jgi:serine/threonine protein kinase
MNNDAREPNAEERIYLAFSTGKDFIEKIFHITSQICPHININYYAKIAVKLLDYEIITEAKDSEFYRKTFELLKSAMAGLLSGDTAWLNVTNPESDISSSACVIYNICFRFAAVFFDHLQQNIKEDESKKIERNILAFLGERTCKCPLLGEQNYPLLHIFNNARQNKLTSSEFCSVGENNKAIPVTQGQTPASQGQTPASQSRAPASQGQESLFKQRSKCPQLFKTAALPLQTKEVMAKKNMISGEMPAPKRFLGRNLTDNVVMPVPPAQPQYTNNEMDTTNSVMTSQLEQQEQMLTPPGEEENAAPRPSGFKIPGTMKLSVLQREGFIKKNSHTGPVPKLEQNNFEPEVAAQETVYDMAANRHYPATSETVPEQVAANKPLQPKTTSSPVLPKVFKFVPPPTPAGQPPAQQANYPKSPSETGVIFDRPQQANYLKSPGETGVIFDGPQQANYLKSPGETGVIFDVPSPTNYPKLSSEAGMIFNTKKSIHTPTKQPTPIGSNPVTPILRKMSGASTNQPSTASMSSSQFLGQPGTASMSPSQFLGQPGADNEEAGQIALQQAKARPQSGRIPKAGEARSAEGSAFIHPGYLAAGEHTGIAAQIPHSISLTQAARNKFYNPHMPKNRNASWQQQLCGRTIRNGLLLPRGYQQNQLTANTINIKKLLGRGGNGEVYLVEYGLLADFRYVLKMPLPPLEMNTPLFLEEIVKLKRIKAIDNPHLPRIVASEFQSDNEIIPFYLMHELQPIERLLGAPKKTPLYPPSCLMFFYCLLRALRDLSLHHIIHCDIKPENILFYREIPMLMDFGASRTYDEINELELGKKTGLLHGTPTYLPPEIIQMEQRLDGLHVVFCMDKVSQKVDIWALGLLLMSWLTGKSLFEGIPLGNNLLEMFEKIYQQFQEHRLAQYRHECERLMMRLYLGSDSLAMNRLREVDIQKFYVSGIGTKDKENRMPQRFRGIDFRGTFFTDLLRLFDLCTAPYQERPKPIQLLNEVENLFPWLNEKYNQMISDLFIPPLEEYQRLTNTNIDQEADILKKINQYFPPRDEP